MPKPSFHQPLDVIALKAPRQKREKTPFQSVRRERPKGAFTSPGGYGGCVDRPSEGRLHSEGLGVCRAFEGRMCNLAFEGRLKGVCARGGGKGRLAFEGV